MAKRGRPTGATSFVRVEVSLINELFKSTQHVPVSRVWLREQGYDLQDSPPVSIQVNKPLSSVEEQDKIEMKLEA